MGKVYRMMKVERPEDAGLESFISELRQDDRRELLALSTDIRKELEESIRFSAECWLAMDCENQPIVLFGRTMVPGRDGALIWCVGTDRLQDYWFAFLRQSRSIIAHWAKEYGFLYNAVAFFNTNSMRWLSWLGAEFKEEIEVNGETFIRFVIEGDDL